MNRLGIGPTNSPKMLNAWHYKPNYGYSMLRDSKNHVREQIFQDRAHAKNQEI